MQLLWLYFWGGFTHDNLAWHFFSVSSCFVVITVTPWAKAKGIARVAAKPANIKKPASPKTTGFIDLLNEKQIVRYKMLFYKLCSGNIVQSTNVNIDWSCDWCRWFDIELNKLINRHCLNGVRRILPSILYK